MKSKISYRPEIDGLRAIAVGAVIIYHARIYLGENFIFQGGFLGVDIFFVISGYLITSIIYKELITTKKFSIIKFYERRVRRIVPPLLLVCFSSLILGYIFLFPREFIDLSISTITMLGFVSNYYFYQTGLEYGAIDTLLIPLLHTWSLSVEEQYYILIPLIILAIYKFSKKNFFLIFFLIFTSSIIFSQIGSLKFPQFNFYFLGSRAWELSVGSLLAFFNFKKKNSYLLLKYNYFPFIGILLILFSFIKLDNNYSQHPSMLTLIPIIGTCLIILFASKDEIITKILSSKFFVSIGLISYSLYLWHYPVFAFLRTGNILDVNIYIKILSGLLILFLSILTYFLIEKPSRNNKNSFKKIMTIIFTSIILILITCFLIIKNNGFLDRLKTKNYYQELSTYNYLKQDDKVCFSRVNDFCKFGNGEVKVFLIGDSHLSSLSFDLKERLDDSFTFIPITDAVYFHFEEHVLFNKKTKSIVNNYNKLNRNINELLKKSEDNIIIIGGITSYYFHQKRFANNNPYNPYQYVSRSNLQTETSELKKDFKNLISKLSKKNKIILLYPIPEIGINLNRYLINNFYGEWQFDYNDYLSVNNEIINFFDEIDLKNLIKVKPQNKFCNKTTEKCKVYDDNNIFFSDKHHPSLKGANMINDLILAEIKKIDFK